MTSVETDDNETRLIALMREMAADKASPATFVFADEFHRPLAASMRGHLARHGCRRAGPDEVDGLVLDAAMAIAGCASAWRADGAPPWIWARARLAGIARAHIDQWAGPLDADRRAPDERVLATAFAGDDRFLRDVLDDVVDDTTGAEASDAPVLALLAAALDEVASRRDQAIVLEFEAQRRSGDPSPSHTVATAFGMRPDAVRQAAHRVRARLAHLAASEPRFAAIGRLPIVGSESPRLPIDRPAVLRPRWTRVDDEPARPVVSPATDRRTLAISA